MHNYFFQPVDLPPLPDRFVQEALHGQRKKLLTTSKDRLIQDQGREYRNAQLQRWELSVALTDWLHAQGVDGFQDVSSQIIEFGSTLGPHTDKWQSCKLFYNLNTGGPDVETVWYQQQGYPLIREKFLLVSDTADLIEVCRMHIPARRWGLINVGIIHEVRCMTETRSTIVASYSEYQDVNLPEQRYCY
jgi:hypothetical protein